MCCSSRTCGPKPERARTAHRRVRFRRRRPDRAARAAAGTAGRGFPLSGRYRTPALRHQKSADCRTLRTGRRRGAGAARREGARGCLQYRIRSGHIAVMGTEATVRGGAYQAAITRLRPQAVVRAMACQVFVALAEEGWIDGAVARDAAQRYLVPLFSLKGEGDIASDTLVLGCTHFPLLLPIIRQSVGTAVNI